MLHHCLRISILRLHLRHICLLLATAQKALETSYQMLHHLHLQSTLRTMQSILHINQKHPQSPSSTNYTSMKYTTQRRIAGRHVASHNLQQRAGEDVTPPHSIHNRAHLHETTCSMASGRLIWQANLAMGSVGSITLESTMDWDVEEGGGCVI